MARGTVLMLHEEAAFHGPAHFAKSTFSLLLWLGMTISAGTQPPTRTKVANWSGNWVLDRLHSVAPVFGLPHRTDTIELKSGRLVITTVEEDRQGVKRVRVRNILLDRNLHKLDDIDKTSQETVRGDEQLITIQSRRIVLGRSIVLIERWTHTDGMTLNIDRHIVADGLFTADEHLTLVRRR